LDERTRARHPAGPVLATTTILDPTTTMMKIEASNLNTLSRRNEIRWL
jgi:hypothetical protein